MSLRMSICAVISLGLTVGAHWVAGQAAQGPPAAPTPPPRVAGSPAPGGSAPAPSPPRVARIPAPAASSLAPDPGPPRVASPASPGLPDDPEVAGLPGLPAGAEPPPAVPPPALDDLPGLDSGFAGASPPALTAPAVPAPPAIGDPAFEDVPAADAMPPDFGPMFAGAGPSAPDDPSGFPGIGMAPPDDGLGLPGIGAPTADPPSDPIFGAPGAVAPDPAPRIGSALPGEPAPAPAIPEAPAASDPIMPAPAPSGGPLVFSSAEPAPPADPSLRTSAVPADGVGAMADGLADRVSEGPRAVELSLVVDQPPTSNINLPMKAVITLRNEGRDDAFDVVVRAPLPDGLDYIEASPPPDEQADDGRTLVWRWASLASGDARVIDLKAMPSKAVPMDVVPRVSSVMAAKARTAVQEPKLKIDLVGPNGPVLKGTEFDFQVTVRNVGNGPAGRVSLVANLSGGLQGYDYEGNLNDARGFELLVGDLQPGEVYGPVTLTVLADGQGEQKCEIEAASPDVVPSTPISTKPVTIVAPDLELGVAGPDSRPVGSLADYVVTVTNKGTAPANEVTVGFFAPESGKPEMPEGTKYRHEPDKRLHMIYWRLPRLDKGETKQFRVPIRLDRIALYTVEVAAHSQGFTGEKDVRRDQQKTEVMGIPDVTIVSVTRKDPVIDVGDSTEFEIRIKNGGSKDATNVQVDFFTTDWLAVERTYPPDARSNPDDPNHHGFAALDRLAPGADRTFVVTVKAQRPGPGVADFGVKVFWDGLPEASAVGYSSNVRVAEGQVARSGASPPR